MKTIHRILALICIILLLLPAASFADDGMHNIADEILDCARNGEDLQDWLDGFLTRGIGSTSDGYIIVLRKLGKNLDYSAYNNALAEKIAGGAISNPVTRQKCALILILNGEGSKISDTFVDETTGKLGVMSYVYGLHLLNNGAHSTEWTADSIVEKVISMQLQDGGWAVRGMFSDTDVTAMVLQVLSTLPETAENVEASVNRALEYLSNAQKESGGYSSYGIENSESAAQIITALCSLGIDPGSDVRFIKNGNSIWDALMTYRLEDGAYTHQAGGNRDENATMQALQAAVAMNQAGTPYFDFSDLPEMMPVKPHYSWKFYALMGIGGIAVLGTVLSLLKSRGKMKNMVLVLVLCAIAAAVVLNLDIQSAADYYGAEVETNALVIGEAFITIRCDSVAGYGDAEVTPEDGVILQRSPIEVHEGDSVFDVLTAAARKYKIHMEYAGASEGFAYLNGINYLYEQQFGELSGWMYSLNGEFLSIGCGTCSIAPGDEIIWNYTLNMGDDLR